jgi:hypothetical protein
MADKPKVGFLQESEGVNSAGRAIFAIGSIWVFAICTFFAIRDKDIIDIMAFFTSGIGALAALKVGQKYMEKKK